MLSQRPRLLLLSHRVPFPTHNGAAIRSWNIFRLLAREYEIHALCFDRADRATASLPMDERLAGLSFCASVEAFPIPQQFSRWRLLRDHAFSLLSGRPYTWYMHSDTAFHGRLRERLAEGSWALAHMDSLDLVSTLPALERAGVPVICTHHNVESQLLERRAEREPSALRARYLRQQGRLLARAERAWLPRVALNAAVSPDDAALLRALAPGANVAVIANGVDTDFFRPSPGAPGGLVFVGGTSWFPNLDALRWVAAELLPELRRRRPGTEVTWVGRVRESERHEFGQVEGLELVGYVDDIRPYLAKHAVFIAPLRTGGGTRLKLLDAMACGKAIVSTSIGAEGLGARSGEHLMLADSAAAFVDACLHLLDDPDLRRRLEAGARALVEREFSWEVIGARQSAAYQAVARPQVGLPQDAGAPPR